MKINCDQVEHIKAALDRYAVAMQAAQGLPRVSRLHKAARLAGLLEIMECLGLVVDDYSGVHNAMIGLEIPRIGNENHQCEQSS